MFETHVQAYIHTPPSPHKPRPEIAMFTVLLWDHLLFEQVASLFDSLLNISVTRLCETFWKTETHIFVKLKYECLHVSIRRSSEVELSLMVRWVVGSILHGDNKGRGMCYPVCGMVHIKEPLLLIDKSSLCGDSGFPFSLSEWSLTICLTPYNRR